MASHVQSSERMSFWTNEKHVQFLNSIEASFIRSMLKNHHHRRRLRLDRLLPDSADSTLDSPHKHTINQPTSGGGKIDGRSSRRSRRISSLPYTSIQDQIGMRDHVVLQMEKKAAENEDEKVHPISPLN